MKPEGNWKERLGVVYSTDPAFSYDIPAEEEQATPPPAAQRLVVTIDRRQRAGKQVPPSGGSSRPAAAWAGPPRTGRSPSRETSATK